MQALKVFKRVFMLFATGYFVGHLITLIFGLVAKEDYQPSSLYLLATFFTIAALIPDRFLRNNKKTGLQTNESS
jgi:hypothetical protein